MTDKKIYNRGGVSLGALNVSNVILQIVRGEMLSMRYEDNLKFAVCCQ